MGKDYVTDKALDLICLMRISQRSRSWPACGAGRDRNVMFGEDSGGPGEIRTPDHLLLAESGRAIMSRIYLKRSR
ncbi:MAG: hypothetical protein V3T45_05050 [Nitrospinaceae bacterium]